MYYLQNNVATVGSQETGTEIVQQQSLCVTEYPFRKHRANNQEQMYVCGGGDGLDIEAQPDTLSSIPRTHKVKGEN